MRDTYKELSEEMKREPNFLFNYSTVLYRNGLYNESIYYAKMCEELIDNYDVQLLLADNYFKLNDFDIAIYHYKKASFMCPNRFVPLYGLFNAYNSTADFISMLECGKQLLSKPIKVESEIIQEILYDVKNRMTSLEKEILL